MQNTQEVNLAAAYSENPTPCHSSRGNSTTSSASSTRGFRGNKENEGGGRRSKAKSEAKSGQNQTLTLLGKLFARWSAYQVPAMLMLN